MLLQKAKVITTPTAYSDGFLHSVKPNVVLGDELVVNGTFDTDSDWAKGTGWTISGGKANCDGSQTSTSSLYQNAGLTIGAAYKVIVTISNYSAGNIRILMGGSTFGEWVNSNGEKTFILVQSFDQRIYVQADANFVGSIDNVSVKEDISADFTFTRNSSATRVGEDGYIQDVQIIGGELVQNGDFEEIGSELVTNGDFSDGTNNWVNPIYGADNSAELSVLDGALRIEKTADLDWRSSFARQYPISYTNGKIYRVKYSLKDGNTSGADVYIRSNFANSGKTINIKALTSDWVEYTDYYVADSITEDISFGVLDWQNTGTGQYYFVDNVSVKEVGQNWVFEGDWTIGDGTATITRTSSGYNVLRSASSVQIGKNYRFECDVVSKTGGTLLLHNDWTGSNYLYIPSNTSERKIWYFTATSTIVSIQFNGIGESCVVDNISVKEVTDDTNLPRINYEGFSYENGLPIYGSGKGHLLLEGQSTNLVTYSETLGNNALSGAISFTYNNSISPDGTLNAALVSVATNGDRIQPSFTAVNGLVAMSIFVKHNGTDFTTQLNTFNSGDATLYGAVASVTATNVTFTSYQGGFDSANFVDYGNGWFRLIVVCQSTTGTTYAQWRPTAVNTSISYPCFGFQCEVGNLSSYIPTNGSAVTRAAETCNNAGNADLFDSEGVLYAEIAALANDGTNRMISISDGTNANRITLYYSSITNQIAVIIKQSGITSYQGYYSALSNLDYHKIAIRYKDNDFSFWINGVQVGTGSSGIVPSGLKELAFDYGDNLNFPFRGKTKMVGVFPYLSNDEMECLTSEGYGSFEAMALANNYTII